MAEQLALLESDRVYRNDREAWELHEAYYSRPEYAWPLVEYLRKVSNTFSVRWDDARASVWALDALTGPLVEPCVGGHAMVEGIQHYGGSRKCYTGDIRPVAGADWIADWTSSESLGPVFDLFVSEATLVASNPHFSGAMAVVEASWRRCPNAIVAVLQRSTWYEPTREHPRGEWLRKHNPDQVVIGRCKFTLPDGTSCGPGDSCSYTWYVWGPGRHGLLGGHSEIIPWWEAPDATLR